MTSPARIRKAAGEFFGGDACYDARFGPVCGALANVGCVAFDGEVLATFGDDGVATMRTSRCGNGNRIPFSPKAFRISRLSALLRLSCPLSGSAIQTPNS